MTSPVTHQLRVSGISCQHCVKAITQAIQEQDGAAEVTVDIQQGLVSVHTVMEENALRAILVEEGYGVVA